MLEDYLKDKEFFHIDLGLGRMEAALCKLGNPEKELKFIHIAGTNGKGSCGAMLECALRHCGYRTGFYSSPHLVDFRERFRVDGQIADDGELEQLAAGIGDNQLTYFEFATVLAILYFRAQKCDYIIWETGMGGRLDATNAVTPVLSVITGISLEHQKYLGRTVEEIAGEKAGIIKPGVPVFAGIMPAAARKVVALEALEKSAELTMIGGAPEKAEYFSSGGKLFQKFPWRNRDQKLSLLGPMQRRNFALSAAVLEYLHNSIELDLPRALESLSQVDWPGRLSIDGDWIIDGAHNPDGVRALVESVREIWPGEKFVVIFGAFKDKEVKEELELLSGIACEFVFAEVPGSGEKRPCYQVSELGAMVALPYVGKMAESRFQDKYRKLLCGSLYMVGGYFSRKINF